VATIFVWRFMDLPELCVAARFARAGAV
jgi:hypothetical protein